MPEDKKGLSWFRLILLQASIGCLLIVICANAFRIPLDEVHIVSPQQDSLDRFAGVPMRMEVMYPGLGTTTIDDPKELLKLKASFSELLSTGKQQAQSRPPRLLLSGAIAYLDQEDIPFRVETNAFQFGEDRVDSLNVSADIRKLQSLLIDKVLTTAMIGSAVENTRNDVFSLEKGVLTPLSLKERKALIAQMKSASRVIDFSHLEDLAHQPDAHFVVQLSDDKSVPNHWLHLDRYNSAYIIVYDLLDETNHRAYFKIESS